MTSKKRVGIVLFQLGGPDSLDSVEPFLTNLFLDPDILPLGPAGFLRGFIARRIARGRAGLVAQKYAEIGGRSPIRALTERQRDRLAEALAAQMDPVVVIAMRYWHPLTGEA
ncbi:MAG TPA: ferrochelatase, partial [Methylomirabilota bacterium]|nr:ferrochelatase [Methylomirabilota bacterium]